MSQDPRQDHERELSRLRPDVEGAYAWDHWQMRALETGLDHDLSQLGRAVMREAVQHAWCPSLLVECGWEDDGQDMLDLARLDPATARRRWEWLLDTDGGQVEWDEISQTFHRLTSGRATQHVGWPLSRTELRQACLLLWRCLARHDLTDAESLLVDSALWHCRGILGVPPTEHYRLPQRKKGEPSHESR